MAQKGKEEKKQERFRETVDEYYAFKNEFPNSKHIKEAGRIFDSASKEIKD